MSTPGQAAIASNEVLTLFPTIVCRVQLDTESREPLNRAIRARLDALVGSEPPPAAGERLRTGRALHRFEEMVPLAEFVQSNAEGMLSYLMAVHGGIEVSACWADVLGPGSRVSDEASVNAYLGALYFCNLPGGEARVTFRDPRRQSSIISAPSHRDRFERNAVVAREGTLLLFPGWLERGLDRRSDGSQAACIGFELMFNDFTETLSRPLWEGDTYKRA